MPGQLPVLAPLISAPDLPPRQAIDRIAGGFRALQLDASVPGLRARELDGGARRDLLAVLRRREITLAGIDLWIPAEHFDDPASVDRAAGVAVETIRLAGDLGNCSVSLMLPGQSTPDGAVRDVLVKTAQDLGVPLSDHTVPPCDDALVGIGVDPAGLLAAAQDPALVVAQAGSRLVSARVVDLLSTGMRGPIGTPDGRLDVQAYQVALSVAGYTAPAVIDSRQWANSWAGVMQTAAVW